MGDIFNFFWMNWKNFHLLPSFRIKIPIFSCGFFTMKNTIYLYLSTQFCLLRFKFIWNVQNFQKYCLKFRQIGLRPLKCVFSEVFFVVYLISKCFSMTYCSIGSNQLVLNPLENSGNRPKAPDSLCQLLILSFLNQHFS
jgi:hypothetical protein